MAKATETPTTPRRAARRAGPGSDARLLELLDAARRLEDAQEVACVARSRAEKAGDKAGAAAAEATYVAAGDELDSVLAQMAETPAETLAGVAAKAARLTRSLSEHAGRSLLFAEHDLVDSLAADLARLMPEARA